MSAVTPSRLNHTLDSCVPPIGQPGSSWCHVVFGSTDRHERGQQPGQPDRLVGEGRPPVRVVALGEQQVQHRQHTRQPLGQCPPGRHPVRDPGVGDLRLRPGQPPGHRRLGDQEGTGDVGGRHAPDGPQRQRHPRFQRQRRVAAGEDEPQPVVHDLALLLRRLLVEQPRQRGQFPALDRRPPQHVDRPVAGRSHQPPARVGRHPVDRPPFQRRRHRVLRAVLGQRPVAGDPDEGGHDPGPPFREGLGDGQHQARLPNGRSSSRPVQAIGCARATSIASSRSAHSRMS